jgi:MFS family permease
MRLRAVAAGFLVLAIGSLVANSFAVFLVTLSAEFGWSHSSITLAFGIYALTAALASPLLGWALARYDSRVIFAALSIISAVGLALTATMHSVVQYWLLFGLLGGIGSHSYSSMAIFTVIGSRFTRNAATAMSIADSGAGLATFLGMPAVYWVITGAGWRTGYLLLAALSVTIGLAAHLLLLPKVRKMPARRSNAGAGRLPRLGGPLALMALAFACGPAAFQALQTQQIALLQDGGVAPATGVWVASTMGLAIFGWRFVSGWLCDRIGVRLMMTIAAVGATVGFLMLSVFLVADVDLVLLAYPLGGAIGFGSQAMLLAVGLRHIVASGSFAPIFGLMRTGFGIGVFAGPTLAALLFDLTRSYGAAVAVAGMLAVVHFGSFHLAIRTGSARRRQDGGIPAARQVP